MHTWRFSTDSFVPLQRYEKWTEALSRLKLPIGELSDKQEFFGEISCLTSTLGLEFARVKSVAQEIAGEFPKQEGAIWLTVLIEGQATLVSGDLETNLLPGDILHGTTGMPARLIFDGPFTQLFVKIPHLAINPRLLAPLSVPLGHLPGRRGISSVFSSMLVALASTLDNLREEQLKPIELSITDFILTCLSDESTSPIIGAGDKARSLQLHSICQTIETLLGDFDLNPPMVAEIHGISLRYLQKLFTQNDNTFTNYVKHRRLERCRADLVSPIYAQMSVTEICFRWGFNGSAHFSRSFKAKYGYSPREYRRSAFENEG